MSVSEGGGAAAVRLRADELQPGDVMIYGDSQHVVRTVRRRGKVIRVQRDDGQVDAFFAHHTVTFIPRERLAS